MRTVSAAVFDHRRARWNPNPRSLPLVSATLAGESAPAALVPHSLIERVSYMRLPTVLVRVLEYLCVMKTAENEIRPARQVLHGSNVPLLQCSFAVLSRAVADFMAGGGSAVRSEEQLLSVSRQTGLALCDKWGGVDHQATRCDADLHFGTDGKSRVLQPAAEETNVRRRPLASRHYTAAYGEASGLEPLCG
jgi:hypothetical protein